MQRRLPFAPQQVTQDGARDKILAVAIRLDQTEKETRRQLVPPAKTGEHGNVVVGGDRLHALAAFAAGHADPQIVGLVILSKVLELSGELAQAGARGPLFVSARRRHEKSLTPINPMVHNSMEDDFSFLRLGRRHLLSRGYPRAMVQLILERLLGAYQRMANAIGPKGVRDLSVVRDCAWRAFLTQWNASPQRLSGGAGAYVHPLWLSRAEDVDYWRELWAPLLTSRADFVERVMLEATEETESAWSWDSGRKLTQREIGEGIASVHQCGILEPSWVVSSSAEAALTQCVSVKSAYSMCATVMLQVLTGQRLQHTARIEWSQLDPLQLRRIPMAHHHEIVRVYMEGWSLAMAHVRQHEEMKSRRVRSAAAYILALSEVDILGLDGSCEDDWITLCQNAIGNDDADALERMHRSALAVVAGSDAGEGAGAGLGVGEGSGVGEGAGAGSNLPREADAERLGRLRAEAYMCEQWIKNPFQATVEGAHA
jgi:hypothetical protein